LELTTEERRARLSRASKDSVGGGGQEGGDGRSCQHHAKGEKTTEEFTNCRKLNNGFGTEKNQQNQREGKNRTGKKKKRKKLKNEACWGLLTKEKEVDENREKRNKFKAKSSEEGKAKQSFKRKTPSANKRETNSQP